MRLVHPFAVKIESMKKEHRAGRLNVLSLPPNARHCKKYMKRDGTGACPNLSRCEITTEQEMLAITGEDNYMASILNMLAVEQGPLTPGPQGVPTPMSAPSINPAPAVALPFLGGLGEVKPAAAAATMPAPASSGSVAIDTVLAQARAEVAAPATMKDMFEGLATAPGAQERRDLKERMHALVSVISDADDCDLLRKVVDGLKPFAIEAVNKF